MRLGNLFYSTIRYTINLSLAWNGMSIYNWFGNVTKWNARAFYWWMNVKFLLWPHFRQTGRYNCPLGRSYKRWTFDLFCFSRYPLQVPWCSSRRPAWSEEHLGLLSPPRTYTVCFHRTTPWWRPALRVYDCNLMSRPRKCSRHKSNWHGELGWRFSNKYRPILGRSCTAERKISL